MNRNPEKSEFQRFESREDLNAIIGSRNASFMGGFHLKTQEMNEFEQFIIHARNQLSWSRLFEMYENQKMDSRNNSKILERPASKLEPPITLQTQSKISQDLKIFTVSFQKDTVDKVDLDNNRKRKQPTSEEPKQCEGIKTRKRRNNRELQIPSDDILDWDYLKKIKKIQEPITSKQVNQKGAQQESQELFMSVEQKEKQEIRSFQASSFQCTGKQGNVIKIERTSTSEFEEGSFTSQDKTDASAKTADDEEIEQGQQKKLNKIAEKMSDKLSDKKQKIKEEATTAREISLFPEEDGDRDSADQFIKSRSVNKNWLFVSERAQALIPAIQSITEVRKSWVQQDLDALLVYKASPKLDKLQEFIDGLFGARKPQEAFKIFKANDFSLEKSKQYIGIHFSLLKDYFSTLDKQEEKLQSKRKRQDRKKLINQSQN